MTDPATARVGMKRHGFALHYFDCQTLRDVVFEVRLWRTGCLKLTYLNYSKLPHLTLRFTTDVVAHQGMHAGRFPR